MSQKNWYQQSREAIQRVYGADWKFFCALLALTSPRASVKTNLTLAAKAYRSIKQTGTVERSGYMRTAYNAILHYLKTGVVRG